MEAGFSSQISVGISAGKPATIRLSLNQVGALAITLPGLVDKALRTRYGDQSLRYAYPLASWVVEQSSDPTHGMVALRTVDGFSVCFSIPRAQQSELGEALGAAGAQDYAAGKLSGLALQPSQVKISPTSFRGAKRTRNLEILRCAIAHRNSMLRIAPE